MSWHPNDLVTDRDLLGYERHLFDQFNVTEWTTRRAKVLEDWLRPLLESAGFDPQRLRTRYEPEAVLSSTASVFTDRTAAAATAGGLVLPSILASASDALYVGSSVPFRGVFARMTDSVNTVTLSLGVTVWTESWASPEHVEDQTRLGVASLARGGSIAWDLPPDLVVRSVNSVGPYYWAKVTASATPTAGTAIGPVFTIRRSRLSAPATLRTLALIFREAPIAQDGPWLERAQWYEAEAERAWMRVVDHIGGEFDSDQSDAISSSESEQTAASVSGGGWSLERS